MVRLPDSGGKEMLSVAAVKLEGDDSLENEQGPDKKRSKCSFSFPEYNPLDEPSPLGLRLRKSPSLVDLIQMRLSQENSSKAFSTSDDVSEMGKKKDHRASSASSDKIKASNFPATILRIGTWECVSRYEGDLVAKCYFAKRKLVWEVLDGGLKSKIEIQWSDILDIKASYAENSPGTLDIVLARQPLFFRETNPQPRKHTLWQATSDFTGGQASKHRKHFLRVPQGLLSKHFEKLIQCDARLNSLSRQPEIVLDSPYFDSSRSPVLEDQDLIRHRYDDTKNEFHERTLFPGFHDTQSPCPSTSSRSGDLQDHEAPSPCSALDSGMNEESTIGGAREVRSFPNWDQLKVPGLHPSMSMTDIFNHIEKMTSGEQKDVILEDITQYLLSDSQSLATSDENSLMSRVNSLCCLLQKEPTQRSSLFDLPISEEEDKDGGPPQRAAISRKESFGELLLQLPRIASLPKFFFNAPDDKAR
ncbi:uncharacterized protein LOC144704968 [Wolffia australiana]